MFLINLQGKDSIYEQIRNQILKFIQLGILKPNDKLPSVRQLAQELGINPNTVQKAYQELEKEGYIYTLNKKGAFVADVSERHNQKEELKKLILSLKEKGISKEELSELIEEVYKGGFEDVED